MPVVYKYLLESGQCANLVNLTGSKSGQVGSVVYKYLLESGQCSHLIDLTGSKSGQVG